MLKSVVTCVLALSFAACGSVGVTTLRPVEARPDDCKLDMYSSEKEITRPYVAVCLIDSQTASNAHADRTAAGAVNKAKPAACKCGADAIVIETLSTQGTTAFGWGSGTAILKGIRYQDGL